jgi:beta-lactamase regulating signal transducer with metallopeptidase domain
MDANELIALLWYCAWVSSLATCVVLALRQPVRRLAGAGLAYAVWALVPLLALVSVLPRYTPVQRIVMDIAAPALATTGGTVLTLPPATWIGSWSAELLWAWAIGVVMAMALAFLRQCRFRKHLHHAERLGTSERGIVIYRAKDCLGPALIGVWRPTIVVPVDFETRYDDRERTLILAHEHMHAARGDGLANVLCTLLLAMAWFNPLAHLGARVFRRDQEMACDEMVMRRHGQLHIYASAMLKTALACPPLPAGCAWSPVHPLKERIVMLSRSLPGRGRRLLGMASIALGALVAAGVTYGANPAWDAGREVGVAVETASPMANSRLCAAPKCPELPAPPAPPVPPVVATSPRPTVEPAVAAEPNLAPAPAAAVHR